MMFQQLWNVTKPNAVFYIYALPMLLWLGAALISMLCAALSGYISRHVHKWNCCVQQLEFLNWLIALVLGSVAVVMVAWTWTSGNPMPQASGLSQAVIFDRISLLGHLVVSFGTVVLLCVAQATGRGRVLMRPDGLALLLFTSAGLMVMISSGEFISFLVGLEVASLALYALISLGHRTAVSLEGSIKYFLLGALAAAFMLMGAAFLYLSSGSLFFADWHKVVLSVQTNAFAVLGVVLFVAGLAFKLSLAPLHFWSQDVYEAAPSILTGYMASVVKLSVILVLVRFLAEPFATGGDHVLLPMFWLLGMVSMIVGSVFGLVQTSVKRILAYSSVANAGYFCLPFATLSIDAQNILGAQSALIYGVVYMLMSLGSFVVLAWLEEVFHSDNVYKAQLVGLGRQEPIAAIGLTIFLLGLAGIPPLAGFFGKVFILWSAVQVHLMFLPIILVITSCISMFYYLSLIAHMWFGKSQHDVVLGMVPSNHAVDMSGMMVPAWRFVLQVVTVVLAVAVLVMGLVGPQFLWAIF